MRPHSHELVTFKDEWDHIVCLQNIRDLYFFPAILTPFFNYRGCGIK